MKNVICISGNIAVGKTEVALKLSEKLGYTLYKASESFRKLARDMNMDLVSFNDYVKENPEIDLKIEETTKKVADENDKIVIDARLGFFLCPEAFKVYMLADIDTAASRLFKASKLRGKEEEYESIKDAKHAIELRENSERERYLKTYNVDIHDKSNYDFVIDTTNLSSDEVVDIIIEEYLKFTNSED